MMKTPDEIKKGLECCAKGNSCRGHCPYDGRSAGINECTSRLARDALTIIPRWISVEERLPERGVCKTCLVYAEEFTCVADWSCDRYGDDWWFYVDGEYEPLVTHWMPLPEPPKEEHENEG